MNPDTAATTTTTTTTAALLQAALVHHRAGRLVEAERLYRQLLAADPYNADALHLLGMIAHSCRQSHHAADLIERAIAINPGAAAFHSNRAIVLRDLGRYDEALASAHRSLAIEPAAAGALFVLASVLQLQGDFEAAAEVCERLLAAHPDHVPGHLLATAAALRLDRVAAAIALAERAVAISPANPSAHWNLAWALLVDGQFERGWEELEWRLEPGGYIPQRTDLAGRRFWRREDLSESTLLLYCEGGFGDALQFVRYVPLLAGRARSVFLECPRTLFDMFKTVRGVSRLIARGESLPQCDFVCPLPSLPYNFRTTLETIPATVPYLSANEQHVRAWKARLPEGFKVGLAWAGSAHPADKRSRSLATFAPLAGIAGLQLISLQIGPEAAQLHSPPPGMTLRDYGSQLTDFSQTAALVANLDLIITVDTSVAHLAGALAKPTWVLIPFAPDFRWLRERSDSPWYPTMRLFRQSRRGDWTEPLEQMATALRELTETRG